MKKAEQIEVLIADDFPVVRAGLRLLIDAEEDMRVVAEAADGAAAVECFKVRQPDAGADGSANAFDERFGGNAPHLRSKQSFFNR